MPDQKLSELLTSADAANRSTALRFLLLNVAVAEQPQFAAVIKTCLTDEDITVRFWARKLQSKLLPSQGPLEGRHPGTGSALAGNPLSPNDGSGPANPERSLGGQIGEQPLEVLIARLDTAPTGLETVDLLREIFEQKNPASYEPLREYLGRCREVVALSYLVKNLGRYFPREDLVPLLARYLKHDDERTVANAIEGLEAIGTPPTVVLFTQMLDHRSHRVRCNAVKGLAKFDRQKAIGILSQMLRLRDNLNFVVAACHAARELRARELLPDLIELVSEPLIDESAIEAISVIIGNFLTSLFEKKDGKKVEGRAMEKLLQGIEKALASKCPPRSNPWSRQTGSSSPPRTLDVGEQKIFALNPRLSAAEAEKMACDSRRSAFGFLNRMIYRPDEKEIALVYSEIRYEPFWHISCKTRLDFTHTRNVALPVDKTVVEARIGLEMVVASQQTLTLPVTEHGVEEGRQALFVDAQTGQKQDHSKHIAFEKRELRETEELMVNEHIVMPARIKASLIIRDLLGELMKPVKADEINEERVFVDFIHLYFRPVYAFEFSWKGYHSTAVYEVNGLTGELISGKTVKEKFGEILTEETLFEVGAEALGLVVPGGELMAKLFRAVLRTNSTNP